MAESPIRPTDQEARALARQLLQTARFAALAVIRTDSTPLVTRVAFGLDPTGKPLTLVSDLSEHTKALRHRAECSLLIGEPGDTGDPLTHPRITLQARAGFVAHGTDAYQALAAHYLKSHPKAKLYIGFADFIFLRFDTSEAFLNGGFGKAFHLSTDDLFGNQW
jgi:putative heme iron utilization protein